VAFWLRIFISGAAIAILATRTVFPELSIDAIALGLLALAILPWVTSLLESAELPGGIKITFRQVREAGEKVVSQTVVALHHGMSAEIESTYRPLVFPT